MPQNGYTLIRPCTITIVRSSMDFPAPWKCTKKTTKTHHDRSLESHFIASVQFMTHPSIQIHFFQSRRETVQN